MSYSESKYDTYTIEDWIVDDDFISYVNGAVNPEISDLEQNPKFSGKIIQAKTLVGNLQGVAPYVSEEKLNQLFERVNKTLDSKVAEREPSLLILHRWKWMGAVAAAIALLIVFLPAIFSSNQVVSTKIAQTETVTLPDNSIVELNNTSEVKFLGKEWDRKVQLKGEAFFKVEKGSKFTVTSNQGKVSVLGTQFNIYDRAGLYEVECIEGRVQVDLVDGSSHILNAGDKLSDYNNQQQPVVKTGVVKEIDWRQSYVQVDSMDLGFVFDEVKRYYKVAFENEEAIRGKRYEGFFSTTSIDSAIYQILWPLGIEYSIVGDKVIIK